MKIKNIILGFIASVAALASCDNKEDLLGAASLKVDKATVEIPQEGGAVSFSLKATRDWTATISPENSGFELSATSGAASLEAQTITISADANAERRRTATITVKISETLSAKVKVSQAGAKGDIYTVSEIREFEVGEVFPEAKIRVVLLSDHSIGNVHYKNLYVQDETGGIQIRLASGHEFAKGDQLLIDLEGAEMSQYGQMLQVELANEKITKESSGNALTAAEATLEEFFASEWEGRYISLSGVQVVEADLDKNYVVDDKSTEIRLESQSGILYIYTYNESGAETPSVFTTTKVPQGSGTIKGIASRYNDKFQLVLTSLDDVAGMNQERFAPTEYVSPKKTALYPNGDQGSFPLTVESNCAWTVSVRAKAVEAAETEAPGVPQWLSVSPESGDGNGSVTVSYEAYDDTENPREAEIVFTCGTGETVVSVKQIKHEEKTVKDILDNVGTEDDTYYRTTGTIKSWYTTKNVDEAKAQELGWLYLADSNGNYITIYGCKASIGSETDDFNTLGLSPGDIVTVEGAKDTYNNKGRLANAYVVSSEKTQPVTTMAEALTAPNLTKLALTGNVVAVGDGAFVLAQNGQMIYVRSEEEVALGDILTATGLKDLYYGLPRVEPAVVSDKKAGTVSHTEVTDLTAESFDSHYTNWSAITYVKVSGLAEWQSDNRLHIAIEGVTGKDVCLYYPKEDMSVYDGAEVEVYGYSVGVNTSKNYLQVMPVSVEAKPFVAVSVASKEVSAQVTSVDFDVNSNMSWTVTKSAGADWVTSFTESGNNIGKVTVTLSENKTTSPRTATLTLQAQGQQDIHLTITQKGVSATDTWELVENASGVIAGTYVIAFEYKVSDNETIVYAMKNAAISKNPAGEEITVTNGTIDSPASELQWTLTASETGKFSVSAGNNYLSSTDAAQGLVVGSTQTTNTWCFTDDSSNGLLMQRADQSIARYVAATVVAAGPQFRYYNTGSNYKGKLKLFRFVPGASSGN